MRRVKKEEVKFESWIPQDGLTYCLDCWRSYMSRNDADLGASRMKLTGAAADQPDVHERQYLADLKIGAATDAMIDSLKPVHRWAIYRVCRVTTQWNFPSANFPDTLRAAEDSLREKLQKNIETRTYFS